MPEKSGIDADRCAPILAGVTPGATCCPEAGLTAAANVTIKSKCRCTFMTTSPSNLAWPTWQIAYPALRQIADAASMRLSDFSYDEHRRGTWAKDNWAKGTG